MGDAKRIIMTRSFAPWTVLDKSEGGSFVSYHDLGCDSSVADGVFGATVVF
jgi:hypothetical protein